MPYQNRHLRNSGKYDAVIYWVLHVPYWSLLCTFSKHYFTFVKAFLIIPLQFHDGFSGVIIVTPLTHLPWTKWLPFWQTTFWNAFTWMKVIKFRFKFHWNLFPGVQLTINQHWFRQWIGAEHATCHYLNHWWPSSLTHICDTWGGGVTMSALLTMISCGPFY